MHSHSHITLMENKTAYLIVLCCFLLHMTVLGSDIAVYHTVAYDGTLVYLLTQAVTYLLYPLLGWLADVYFSRYKFVLFSFIATIVATLLTTITSVLFMYFSEYREIFILGGIGVLVGLAGIGLFESTAIQFGMDQMMEASSDQLSTFIHWYNWSCSIGQVVNVYISSGVLEYFSHCTINLNLGHPEDIINVLHPHYFTITSTVVFIMTSLQLMCACVGLCLLVYHKKHLNIDRTGENLLKLIYKVLKYAWKHTCPERRSAFTYWEEDIPPRIDLGKSKYGGPFTTEEVEDTKTFFSILLLFLSMIGFHLSGHGYSVEIEIMKNQCPSHWVLIAMAQPLHLIYLTTIIGVPLYEVVRKCCPNYNPSMLKRMGFGLFCCLIKEAVTIIIQTTMNGNGSCNHFDKNAIDSCYFLTIDLNINGTCLSISNATNNLFYCDQNNTPFLLLLIPNILQGLSFFLVFMTALEFICAQAPLRLKGLLIGLWYALLATTYLLVEVPELFTVSSLSWTIFHAVKAFAIFLSLMIYMCVSNRYQYRLRDEVVNEQFLVEEIYERRLKLAEEHEKENAKCNHNWSCYGAINY